MSVTGSIVIYVILWWLILFTVLPRDINSQKDKDYIVQGTDPGAPSNPNIVKKLIITTAITSILFAIIYFLNYFDILNVRRIVSQ